MVTRVTTTEDGTWPEGITPGKRPEEYTFDEMLAIGEALPPAPPPWWRSFLKYDADGRLDFDGCMDDVFGIPRHDLTAAKKILMRHEDEFYYVSMGDRRGTAGTIRIWDGRLWVPDLADGNVMAWIAQFWKHLRRALDTVKAHIQATGEQKLAEYLSSGLTEEQARKRMDGVIKPMNAKLKQFEMYWESLGKASSQRSLVTQMCSERMLVSRDGEFDNVPSFMVLPNGVFDLGVTEETGGRDLTLLPHSSARKVTLMSHVEYRPEADCPMFKKYLSEVFPDDETRIYLQKALGSALLGKPKDKKMINLIGPRNSGKTLLISVISAVLGQYCRSVSVDAFMTKKFGKNADGPSPALHSARLAKMLVASEPDGHDRWDGGLLKALTGGDKMNTRNPYGTELIEWEPRFLIVIASNHFVKLDAENQALVNRIAPVKFPHTFVTPDLDADGSEVWPDGVPVGQRADLGLKERIIGSDEEMSGVLNWLLEGLRMYLRDGLGEPGSVRDMRGEMELENSLVLTWLDARIEAAVFHTLTLEEAGMHGLATGAPGVPLSKRLTLKDAWADFTTWYATAGYTEGGRTTKAPVSMQKFEEVVAAKWNISGGRTKLAGRVWGFDRLYAESGWAPAEKPDAAAFWRESRPEAGS